MLFKKFNDRRKRVAIIVRAAFLPRIIHHYYRCFATYRDSLIRKLRISLIASKLKANI
jgi:hypothetical protein